MSRQQLVMTSSLGPLYLVASAEGLCGVHWDEQPGPFLKDCPGAAAATHLLQASEQIHAYLNGERQDFDLPLVFHGSAFQLDVWNELRRIPYGQTISYAELANRVKHPKAWRAVGSANGKNPLCLVVPCHRVRGADGTLGGYSGGVERKRWLLQREAL